MLRVRCNKMEGIILDVDAIRTRMRLDGPLDGAEVTHVAGADLSFWAHRPDLAVAVLTLCSLEPLRLIWLRAVIVPLPAEYKPGYLAQREASPILALLDRLRADVAANTACPHKRLQDALAAPAGPDGWLWRSKKDALRFPDAVLIDGCGFLHQFRAGLACVVAVNSGFPTAGVAKTLLEVEGISRHSFEPAWEAATESRLCDSSLLRAAATELAAAGGAGSGAAHDADAAESKAEDSSASASAGASSVALHGPSAPRSDAKRVHCAQGQSMDLVAADGTVLGRAVRTYSRSKWPVYVSVGSGMSLDAACSIALKFAGVGSVPFPIQEADRWGRNLAAAWPPPPLPPAEGGREGGT